MQDIKRAACAAALETDPAGRSGPAQVGAGEGERPHALAGGGEDRVGERARNRRDSRLAESRGGIGGPQEVHLIQVEKHSTPEGQHFAFRVADINAVVSGITSHGVEVVGPFPGAGGGWQAFLRDPAGNLIELNQPES